MFENSGLKTEEDDCKNLLPTICDNRYFLSFFSKMGD